MTERRNQILRLIEFAENAREIAMAQLADPMRRTQDLEQQLEELKEQRGAQVRSVQNDATLAQLQGYLQWNTHQRAALLAELSRAKAALATAQEAYRLAFGRSEALKEILSQEDAQVRKRTARRYES